MRKYQWLACCIVASVLIGCSKKHVADRESGSINNSSEVKISPKALARKKFTAKVITVNDNVAKKSIDGRLYYDLDGHRYWKNFDDGKYYLYNRSMYDDKAFKPH
ncbi:MAG TPA: hypothetical protein VKH37_10790 [Ferruginibacter sp.]|nr:hypothetical protein [Ferruginibacter sp.]